MRALPYEAWKLIEAVSRPRPRWRWPGQPDDRLHALTELGRLGELPAVPHLLGLLVERTPIRAAAAAAVGAILDAARPGALARLEAEIRRSPSWASDQRWAMAGPESIRDLAPLGWLRVPYFGVATFHPNGHVRELALRELDEERSGRELPYLLLRLNDWVAPVRDAAERAVRSRLGDTYAEAWARSLPLVLGLRRRGRHQAEDVVAAVFETLTESGSPILRLVLLSDDVAVRRAAVDLALQAGGDAGAMAAATAVGDADMLVRLRLAQAIRAGEVHDGALAERLRHDPAMGVRREILMMSIERDLPGLDEALRTALLDTHSAVRTVARYYLRKRLGDSVFDPAGTYRSVLREAPDEARATTYVTALDGFAETGSQVDAGLAEPFLRDPRPAVRRAAVRAVAALDPATFAREVVAALDDTSPRVARTAARLVTIGLPETDPEALFAERLDSPLAHVRQEALRGAAALPHWVAVAYLLQAAGSTDQTLAGKAREMLERWVTGTYRVFTTPTKGQADRAERALDVVAEMLPSPLAGDVNAALRRLGSSRAE